MTTWPRAVLLYPPITDPTSGYHSLSYIDSYAVSRGHQPADLIDVNIEAFHYSYSPRGVEWLTSELARPRRNEEYGVCAPQEETLRANLLRAGDPDPDSVREAVSVLRDPVRFYDYRAYQNAVDAIIGWMNCLGRTGFVGQFKEGFHLQLPPLMAIGTLRGLTDVTALATLSRPFQAYYDEVLLPRLRSGGYDLVGINITYQWQLPFALWLLRLIRRALPDVFIVLGGTEVSDVWKYAVDKRLIFDVFPDADAIVVGEGESAYTAVLDAVGAGTLPTGHPNVRLNPRYGAKMALPMLHYEKLAELPTPDFSRLPWDSYLSPERFVYYAPTRGCYWNKCTFCDYGLNGDSPTSPWRQDTVDVMLRDVTALSSFAKFIYFSVDVLAPAAILRFAERVVAEQVDIRWGAEIRLEKYWSQERCELLKRSGCTAISVGFESASQRILDLINKGTRPERVLETITHMTKAGIGVQMMGFTGFPTETKEEAFETIDFLARHRDLWTFGGLGEFVLTPGAIVAKQPEQFGISNVRRPENAEMSRILLYDEPISQSVQPEVAVEKERVNGHHYDRPWLGAIDTPHTFFYHDRYGTEVRRLLEDDRTLKEEDDDTAFVINGEFVPRPSDSVLAVYCRLYGLPERQLPANRLVFRRVDGRVFLLPRSIKGLLDLFATPTTLAETRERTWILGDQADLVWAQLIHMRLLRRLAPQPEPAAVTAAR